MEKPEWDASYWFNAVCTVEKKTIPLRKKLIWKVLTDWRSNGRIIASQGRPFSKQQKFNDGVRVSGAFVGTRKTH